jgi:TRAP-type C4-dicarboxylate transport system permease small subunit
MYRGVDWLARTFAQLGGLVLLALIFLTCASVLGRSINTMLHSDLLQGIAPDLADWLLSSGVGPINGDFEIVEAGMAFSIFAFLPICQLRGAHATVDIFTSVLSDGVNRVLRAAAEGVFAAVLILIAVQLYSGMLSKLSSGQTTFLLEFPVWWAYAASVFAAVAAAMVAVYVAVVRVLEMLRGHAILPGDGEAGH